MSCPICSAETVQKYRPFCSRRCADIDLAKWMSGSYAVPAENQDDLVEALEDTFAAPQATPPKPH